MSGRKQVFYIIKRRVFFLVLLLQISLCIGGTPDANKANKATNQTRLNTLCPFLVDCGKMQKQQQQIEYHGDLQEKRSLSFTCSIIAFSSKTQMASKLTPNTENSSSINEVTYNTAKHCLLS